VNHDENRVVTLAKDGEKYIFSYKKCNRGVLLGTLGRFAADSQLNFSWHDAAVLANKTSKDQQALCRSSGGRSGHQPRPGPISPARE